MSVPERLAAAFGDAAAALAIRDDPAPVAQKFLALIEEPIDLYGSHPCWPSLLTSTGLPVELSLKVDATGAVALRSTVDVTDHRAGLARNWTRYLDAAAQVARGTGVDVPDLWDLLQVHLSGIPPAFPSKVMHGHAYAAPDWFRGSLYFRTGWFGRAQVVSRLPAAAAALSEVMRRYRCPVAGPVEVMGYDLVPGEPLRSKAYTWPALARDADFSEVVGTNPDLAPAREVYEAFRGPSDPFSHPRPLLLQTTSKTGSVNQRLFFFASPWGWATPDGLERLLDFAAAALGLDTGRLAVFADVAARYGVGLQLALVAVGAEEGAPSATFYLWPVIDGADGSNRTLRLMTAAGARREDFARNVGAMLDGATDYLLHARDADASWNDYDADAAAGGAATFVTAYVAAALARDEHHHDELLATCAWLAARHRPTFGWGWNDAADADTETTALALEALATVDRAPPDSWQTLARESGEAEVTGAVLSALLRTDPDVGDATATAAASLIAAQSPDGGWNSLWWGTRLLATYRALRALAAYERTAERRRVDEAGGNNADRAFARARLFLFSVAISPEPFALALWLGSWAHARGALDDPRLPRALTSLADLQQPDGRWLGAPSRRIGVRAGKAGSPLHVDARCLVTTATVVCGLESLLAAAQPPMAARQRGRTVA
jgi:hypothetical protein